jgi:phosphate-selective porin OprO and OprP
MKRFSRRRLALRPLVAGVGLALGAGGCAASPLVAEHGVPPWEPPIPWTNTAAAPAKPERPVAIPKATADAGGSGFASEVEATVATVQPATLRAPVPEPAPVATPVPPPTIPPTEPVASPLLSAAVAAPAPKDANIKLRGRIEADAIGVTQSEKSKLLYGNFENAVGFRRARIGAEGTVNDNTRWVGEFDFAGGLVNFKDMFIAVNHLPFNGEVRVGHIAEPFSLEGQTRSVWFPFTERSPQFSLDPARNWGVGVYTHTDDERWVFQVGGFKSGTSNNTGDDIGDGNDMAYDARVVWIPWYDDDGDRWRLLHIGGAISQRYAKNSTVTFNQGPQSNLLQSGTDNPVIPFLPKISIPATQNQLFNLQSALVLGPLSFQAEWSATRVDQIGGGPVNFQGAYVLASYFITGEHRNYNREFGTFWEPTVHSPFACMDGTGGIRGTGAWELTARLAYINYDSPNLAPGPNGLPIGNKLSTVTVGVNWYLNDNARLMFDFVHAVPVDPTFGSTTADLFTVRTAIFW